ncbi:MAG: AhpC/TSA family protein, partial [Dysgonamonadaceae bacterium]|jgi:thiol-disulfide isomerase/thioredoxin|nr:AhpC/TSA family protein [Dysgonamonadaceae bacterium]
MCLLVVACKQSPNQLILTGTGTSAAGDIYVYSMAGNDEPIDTIKVSDGNFTYILDIAGEPLLLVLSDNAAFTRYVVAEKGSISLAGDTALFKGSPLNDRLSGFLEAYSHSAMDVDEKKSAIIETSIREDKELTEAQIAELEALEREEADLVSVVIKKHYEMDKATVVGVFELMCAQRYVSDEDFEAMYEQGGEAIKNFPPFAEMFKIKDVRDKTKVGAKYIDFEGVNPKNTAQTIRVSDFVGKNNYVLLDFWASWCGPCRKAMPEIKKLNDKYAHKGLEIVGVVVNDKLEAHLQAANSLNITWTQLFDNQNESSALYGIDGIPTLILLDKDGTILARTYDKAEIVEKIQSLLGK